MFHIHKWGKWELTTGRYQWQRDGEPRRMSEEISMQVRKCKKCDKTQVDRDF